MRATRTTRQPAPEPLTDAEFAQHIRAAYTALNTVLAEAARRDSNYSANGRARYILTLNEDTNHCRGIGTLEDLRDNRVYDISICFGSSVSDVQLRREFFEDITVSEVRVKTTSLPCLFRNFLEFLRSTQTRSSRSFTPFSATVASRLSAVAS